MTVVVLAVLEDSKYPLYTDKLQENESLNRHKVITEIEIKMPVHIPRCNECDGTVALGS